MTWNRREVLAGLGVASAQAVLWACSAPARPPIRAPQESGAVRTWLHDAVARLLGAGLTSAHALAVSRRRTIAGVDVLGANVGRARCDGVVLTVRLADGSRREQVTSDLSEAGVVAAVQSLVGSERTARDSRTPDFGTPQISSGAIARHTDPRNLADAALVDQVRTLANRDPGLSSRIVYAAAVIEIDDATVWSVAQSRDLEQRLVRVRRALTRVAWNNTRPIVSETSRAWLGGVDDQDLSDTQIANARESALALMTPSAFEDGSYAVVLEPAVAATLIDASVRSLLTTTAARRPEVARRLSLGTDVGSPVVTLVDDPTAASAYGGFVFDDEGEPAVAQMLVEHGNVVGRLPRGRRPGHIGPLEAAPSHVRFATGSVDLDHDILLDAGFRLEGGIGATVDPSSGRVVICAARARELRGGKTTGRVFADIELVGELAPLLASIGGASKQAESIGIRDEVDGQPRWRSIEAPWLRAKGMLRAGRRTA